MASNCSTVNFLLAGSGGERKLCAFARDAPHRNPVLCLSVTMGLPLQTMALRLYNTLSQQLEEFSPARDNTVRMYTCGPTVYDFAHIGNFRTFTFVDVLRKCLKANGYVLNHVMNITDVDDKIIRNAVSQHKSL